MRKIFTFMAVAVTLIASVPAQAQLKFGLKGGLNVTNMSFSSDVVSKDNQTGFFVGPTIKFSIPIAGLGIDAAAVYDQRDAKIGSDNNEKTTTSQRSINVPINLRYNIGLGSMAGVYLAAGPQFGFNVGKKNYDYESGNVNGSYKLKDSNFSINVGAGIMLVSHLEIGFTYNIACGKTGEMTWSKAIGSAKDQVIDGDDTRTNAWQISAAYYF